MSADEEPVVNLAHAGPAPGGGFDLTLAPGNHSAQQVLLVMADAMRTWFTEHEGQNYVEARLCDSSGRQFVMRVAPADKPTAHELRMQAQSELDQALAALTRARTLVEELPEPTGDDGNASVPGRVVAALREVLGAGGQNAGE